MNAKEAYTILILGYLPSGHIWTRSKYEQQSVLYSSKYSQESLSYFSPEVKKWILEAKDYARSIIAYVQDGHLCFDSIYDLLLHNIIDLRFFDNDQIAYRGHLDYSWELTPSLYRNGNISEETDNTIKFINNLLLENRFQNCNDLELLAIAQHYGAKTPLLDFTTDLKVASAFACFNYKIDTSSNFGAIYYYHLDDLKKYCRSTEIITGKPFFVEIDNVERIKRQKGLFIGGFNTIALSQVLQTDMYLFKHNIDSIEYSKHLGFTEKELLIADLKIRDLEKKEMSSVKNTNRLLNIEKLLVEWERQNFKRITHKDYSKIALSFIGNRKINEIQRLRINAFCRWFTEVQKIDNIPLSVKSMTRLNWAVRTIMFSYSVLFECNDILNRLNKIDTIDSYDLCLQKFKEIYRDEKYNPEKHGPYFNNEDIIDNLMINQE